MKRIYLFLNYLKEKFKTSPSDQSDILNLIHEMKHVQNLIDAAENNFNNVTDSDSIDYYIYVLKAYRVRYNKLVKELKKLQTPHTEGLSRYKNHVPSRPTKQILVTEEKLS